MTKKTRRHARKAFTLLEILLVVGLLALLAAFVVPNLGGQGERAKIDLARAGVGPAGSLSQAIELFKFQCDKYPESLQDLIQKPNDPDLEEKWKEPYIKDAQGLKDPWSRDYNYRAPGEKNPKGFDLWSAGPNGISGDEDDIVNWTSDR